MALVPFLRLSLQAAQPETITSAPTARASRTLSAAISTAISGMLACNAAAASAAPGLESVPGHFHVFHSGDGLDDIPRLLEDLESPAQVAGIVVGHLLFAVSLELDLALFDQLLEVVDRVIHLEPQVGHLGVDLLEGLVAACAGCDELLGPGGLDLFRRLLGVLFELVRSHQEERESAAAFLGGQRGVIHPGRIQRLEKARNHLHVQVTGHAPHEEQGVGLCFEFALLRLFLEGRRINFDSLRFGAREDVAGLVDALPQAQNRLGNHACLVHLLPDRLPRFHPP